MFLVVVHLAGEIAADLLGLAPYPIADLAAEVLPPVMPEVVLLRQAGAVLAPPQPPDKRGQARAVGLVTPARLRLMGRKCCWRSHTPIG